MDTTKIKNKLNDSKVVKKSTVWYEKHKRWLPLVSFLAGFSWDNLTLNRIDRFSDNMIMLLYLLLLGGLIVVNHLVDSGRIRYQQISKRRDLFPLGIQFFFGSLFSSYVVFYFQSASLSENWLFLAFLVILLVVNEFIKDRYDNLRLNMALYFMAAFSFSIFFVPILLKVMNTLVFLVSGFLALIFILTILYFLGKQDAVLFRKTGALIGSLFILMNILYFLNWIPPVPLSLKEGGIYHHVKKRGIVINSVLKRAPGMSFLRIPTTLLSFLPEIRFSVLLRFSRLQNWRKRYIITGSFTTKPGENGKAQSAGTTA